MLVVIFNFRMTSMARFLTTCAGFAVNILGSELCASNLSFSLSSCQILEKVILSLQGRILIAFLSNS